MLNFVFNGRIWNICWYLELFLIHSYLTKSPFQEKNGPYAWYWGSPCFTEGVVYFFDEKCCLWQTYLLESWPKVQTWCKNFWRTSQTRWKMFLGWHLWVIRVSSSAPRTHRWGELVHKEISLCAHTDNLKANCTGRCWNPKGVVFSPGAGGWPYSMLN